MRDFVATLLQLFGVGVILGTVAVALGWVLGVVFVVGVASITAGLMLS